MNLPRHSLTSHALKPAFVNLSFTPVNFDSEGEATRQESGSSRHDKPYRSSSSSSASTRAGLAVQKRHDASSKSKAQAGRDSLAPTTGDAPDQTLMTCATAQGFFVARTDPYELVAQREFSALQGGLAHASSIDDSSLMVLVGGGRVPRFAPNKVVLWDEDAVVKIPIPDSSPRMTKGKAASENTASPVASTVFSYSREQGDHGNDGDDDEYENQDDDTLAARIPDEDEEEMDGSTDESGLKALLSSQMTQSITGSLSASSANMDDPFGAPLTSQDEDDERPEDVIEKQRTGESSTLPHSEGKTAGASDARSLDSDQGSEEGEERYRIVKGREVAELEFGEAVQSIQTCTFHVHSEHGGGEEDDDARPDGKTIRTTLLIVSLKRKAVIFEIGPLIDRAGGSMLSRSNGSPSWGICKRKVIDTYSTSLQCPPAIAPVKGSNCALIALPGRQVGHVQLVCLALSHSSRTTIGSAIGGASMIIAAHTNAITNLTLSQDGRTLCTASERGTLLRLWSTIAVRGGGHNVGSGKRNSSSLEQQLNATLVGELRRGTDAARILSIAMTPDVSLLAAASEKGTIHFFDLSELRTANNAASKSDPRPDGSSAGKVEKRSFTLSRQAERYLPSALQNIANSIPTSLLPQYFTSQWSFAQYRISLKTFSGRSDDELRHVEAPPPRRSQQKRTAGQAKQPSDAGGNTIAAADGADFRSSIGEAILPQSARNLDGGWANMRGRVEDIRRGERSTEESIWLTFVPARPSMQQQQEKDQGQHREAQRAGQRPSSQQRETADKLPPQQGRYAYHLIAITSSGGHFRLAVSTPSLDALSQQSKGLPDAAPSEHLDGGQRRSSSRPSSSSSSHSNAGASSTILSMYRYESSSSLAPNEGAADSGSSGTNDSDASTCWLVEHSRFGVQDAWLD